MIRPAPPPDPHHLPPMLGLMSVAHLDIRRTSVYQLSCNGAFPVPVLRIGASYRIPTAPLLDLLGISSPTPPPTATRNAASLHRGWRFFTSR